MNETQASDDLTGDYANSRQGAYLTPAEQMAQEVQEQDSSLVESISNATSTVGSVVSDVAGGVIEMPRQVLGGFLDATKELAQVMEEIIPLGTLYGGEVTEDSFLTTDDPRTVTGGLTRGIAQFLTGFIPAVKGMKTVGATSKMVQVMGGGAVADALVFDPQEERLSDLVQEYPHLQNPITDYLEAEEGDTDAEGRFKNAVEGLALGGVADSFFKAVKVLRSARITKTKVKQLETDKKKAEQISKTTTIDKEVEGEYIPFEEKAAKKEMEFQQSTGRAPDEAAKNINTANIETTDDVVNLIDTVAKSDAPKINKERREVITFEETSRLADELNMSVDDLLDRRRGQAFNAEQAVAARKILVSSGENLINLANIAKSGSDEDVALFKRAMTQHQAIQQQVSGLTAEAGRALGSFRIVADSAKGQERAIQEALEGAGGGGHIKDIAQKMTDLKTTQQLNQFIDGTTRAKTSQALYEVWINALLSSPQTHVVNIVSNAIVSGVALAERKVAQLIGQARGGDDVVAYGETNAAMKGWVEGAKDGMKLAYNVVKTGDPTDPLQKIEHVKYKTISA
ncbi:MAG: hypothetical protein GY820_01545, partial [Gammaproteobacteria bacterium]|nr:hypothetical protein [Gammaproteobacteria bacterium]